MTDTLEKERIILGKRRGLYRGDDLRPLIAPRSVAVIGASQRPNSFGTRALLNALDAKLPGLVGSVNPNYDELHGAACWRSIGAIPETVDCAIVAVPASSVVDSVRDIMEQRKARSILIFSSGLGESGEDGARAEAEIARLARIHGVPVSGPNTVGQLNFVDRCAMSFLRDVDMDAAPVGRLGIVSQSAGIGVGMSHARFTGLELSHALLAGNSADVNVLDLAAYLIDHPKVRAVALALEGLDDPRGMIELGMLARAAGKAIVALKTGRSKTAAAVAQSHTGSLIGMYELYEATFDRAGIIAVETMEELLELGNFFSRVPLASGEGVGVLTNSGGAAVMAADHADEFGVELPRPAPRTIELLGALAPDFASISNPADLTANMSQDWSLLTKAISAFATDPSYSTVVIPVPAPDLGASFGDRPQAIVDAARASKLPLCIVWLSGWREAPGVRILEAEGNIAVFRSMKRCMQALSAWIRWSAWTKRPVSAVETLDEGQVQRIRVLIDAVVASRTAPGSFVLDENRSRELLEIAGVPNSPGGFAAGEHAAIAIAERIGYPVVLKAVVPGLAHKSDVGAVALKLGDAEALRRACEEMRASLATFRLADDLEGFLVCRMEKPGFEAIIGASRDAMFGPRVACGAGGTAVEDLDDIVLRLAPTNREELASELTKLKVWKQLAGGRGAQARDIGGLVDAGLAIAGLIEADPRIAEIDVNPLLVRHVGEGVVALDALLTIDPEAAERG